MKYLQLLFSSIILLLIASFAIHAQSFDIADVNKKDDKKVSNQDIQFEKLKILTSAIATKDLKIIELATKAINSISDTSDKNDNSKSKSDDETTTSIDALANVLSQFSTLKLSPHIMLSANYVAKGDWYVNGKISSLLSEADSVRDTSRKINFFRLVIPELNGVNLSIEAGKKWSLADKKIPFTNREYPFFDDVGIVFSGAMAFGSLIDYDPSKKVKTDLEYSFLHFRTALQATFANSSGCFWLGMSEYILNNKDVADSYFGGTSSYHIFDLGARLRFGTDKSKVYIEGQVQFLNETTQKMSGNTISFIPTIRIGTRQSFIL